VISLIVDTETTGLPLKGVPASDPRQARVMQLGAVLLDGDNEVASFYSKLYPDAWPLVHPMAQTAHGISLEQCEDHGVAQRAALDILSEFEAAADVTVAHNWDFDFQLLTIEYELLGHVFAPTSHFCTMKAMTDICKLTKSNGSPKWPNLIEAANHVGHQWTVKAHDALADVRAAASVFKWLVANGHYIHSY
jgi:DNA polymerase III epsilon subunit-like protein